MAVQSTFRSDGAIASGEAFGNPLLVSRSGKGSASLNASVTSAPGLEDLDPTPQATTILINSIATDVAFNRDRTMAYVARYDGVLTVIDTASGAVINNFTIGTQLGGIAISPDGSFALVARSSRSAAAAVRQSLRFTRSIWRPAP